MTPKVRIEINSQLVTQTQNTPNTHSINQNRSYLHHLCDCSGNSPGLACLLLNCEDIDVNIKDSNGKTPLDLARESRKRQLAIMILKRQQEDEAKAKELETTSHSEAKRRKKKTV